MPNVIRSIATDDEFGTQSIRMIVTSNERGAQGPQGDPGEAATIAAGQAYSVEPGQSPAVMNTGTSSAAVFDFYIPKGEKGDQGEPGPAGADEWGEITGNIADQTDLQNALNGKQNKLTAGSNITISGDTISATNTTYAAGNGLNLNHGEFSVNTGAIQEKLTAGTNVDITGNTISATDTTYTAGAGLALNGTEFSVDTDTIQSKLTAGSNVQINGNTISATDTTYTAGNAITIDSGNNNAINAAIDPADFFTSTESKLTGTGTSVTLTPTAGLPLSSVQLKGDTTQQTYSGKNLLKNQATSGTSADVAITVNPDGTMVANGTANGLAYIIPQTQQQSPDYPAGTYTLWVDQIPAERGELLVETYRAPDYNARINTFRGLYGENSLTFTTTESLRFRVSIILARSGYTVNNFKISQLQLEKNSSKTSFEPYVGGIPAPNPDYPQEVQVVTGEQTVTITDGGSQSQEHTVNLGKNLFDKDNANTLVSCYVDTGTIVSAGGSTVSICYIKCEPNTTYTVQKENTGTNNRFAVFTTSLTPAVNVAVLNVVGTTGSEDNNSHYTITTPNNAKYLGVFFAQPMGASTPSSAEIMATIQIEKGSTATTYAPYFTPIELCKIGTYQDYIYKSGSDWYVRKEIEKVYLGTFTWSNATTGSSSIYRMYTDGIKDTVVIGTQDTKCSHYIGETAADTWSLKIGIAVQAGDGRLFVYDPDYNTSSSGNSFKTWLTNNNVILYYPLATPTDIQITEQSLIDQLDALLAANSYNGSTILTVTSDNQLAILDVGAYRKSLAGIISAIKEL